MPQNKEYYLLPATVPGVFIKELDNRFRGIVYIGEEYKLCYIPSSCKLSNFLNLSQRNVLLQSITTSKNGCEYALLAARFRNHYVLLNSAIANQIVERQISRRYFSTLGTRNNVRKEVTIDGYKSDLYICDTDTVVEIKSIISINRKAEAFTVESERAIVQLEKLYDRLNNKPAAYVFVVMNPTVQEVFVNQESKTGHLLHKCFEKGLKLICISVGLSSQGITIRRKIPFSFIRDM